MISNIVLVTQVLITIIFLLIVPNLATPALMLNFYILILAAIFLEFIIVLLLILRYYKQNNKLPSNPLEIVIDGTKYLTIVGGWFVISIALVQISALAPQAAHIIFNNNSLLVQNNSTPSTLEYKDAVNLYLNSWLTTALVLVGSVQAYNLLFGNKKDEKDEAKPNEAKPNESKN